MNALTAARAQMEVSLAFHMIFAALGIGMPLLMVIAEGLSLRARSDSERDLLRALARKWGKATALLFAVGAVSGTALSFELGLLWPGFMRFSGAVIGPAFALEGYAFFIEAIFVGLYLYGWERLSPRHHWLCGLPVALSGMLSGIFVLAVNAWMQTPVGYVLRDAMAVPTDGWSVFRAPAWPAMALHSTLSCYAATSFAVAGIYALNLAKIRAKSTHHANDISAKSTALDSVRYHQAGLRIALAVGITAVVLQLPSGHATAQSVARFQPIKLAAMEALYHSERGAPLLVGGLPDREGQVVRGAIRLPKMLSLIAYDDRNAWVRGLDDFAPDERPNELVTHLAFETMVMSGMTLLALSGLWIIWGLYAKRARTKGLRPPVPLLLLKLTGLGAPLGFVALEAGWFVTESGRQPWVVRGLLRTAQAVTPASGITASFWLFSVLYLALGAALVTLLRALGKHGTSETVTAGRATGDGTDGAKAVTH
jgi:cytochrome d ubiquinol oxidase subunit I